MAFIVQVAADIFGQKTNFELQFSARPTIQELVRATEAAYTNEIELRRPDHIPPHSFHVAKMKFYDEERNKWSDLVSEAQLTDYTQTYAFQPENQWHKESQREIPAAVRPPAAPRPRTSATSYQPSTVYQPVTSSAAPKSIPARASTADTAADEKIRVVFQEFDHKNHRMIDMEDLMQGFRTLGLEFTQATMNDLFQKGDANHDGRISFSEFEKFAGYYPIMIDCLYYRTKAFWDDQHLQREIDAEQAAVRDAMNLVGQAEQQHRNALKAVEDTQNEQMAIEGDIRDRNDRLRNMNKEMDQAQRDKERAMTEKYDKENDAVAQRDRERQMRQQQQDAAREAEKAARRTDQLAVEAAKHDDKVKLLRQQLAEAERAADRANQNVKQAQGEAEAANQRAQEMARQADNLTREITRFDDALRQAETNANLASERVREIEMISRDIGREVEEAARRRDALERQIQAAKDHEHNMQQEVAQAKRNAEERERLAKLREAELLEQQRQRQLLTQQERQLIEQELRLREQRDSLEQKENVLRSEAQSFISNLQRQHSTRSSSQYQRDPSSTSFTRYDSAAPRLY